MDADARDDVRMTNDYLRQKSIPFAVKLKATVQNFKFNCIGTVSKVNSDGTRVTVTLPYLDSNLKPIQLQGIEVLRPGTHAVQVKYKPSVGDVALVFAMQDYWSEAKFSATPEKQTVKAEPYGNVTMKAILVQTNEDNDKATIIEVKDNELNITTPLKLNVTCEKDITVDAGNSNVIIKSKKTTVNDHLEIT